MSGSSLEANKQLAHRWFEEVWNQQSEAAIDALFAPEGKSHGFPDAQSVLAGPEAFKAIHRNFCGAFPDLHVTVHEVIAEGDKVAIRWTVDMTHTGDNLAIPATGRKATLSGSAFIIVREGQIQDGWNQMDIQHLFQQLS
jgi:steroid delta-isomerase-like uncharacterized protein